MIGIFGLLGFIVLWAFKACRVFEYSVFQILRHTWHRGIIRHADFRTTYCSHAVARYQNHACCTHYLSRAVFAVISKQACKNHICCFHFRCKSPQPSCCQHLPHSPPWTTKPGKPQLQLERQAPTPQVAPSL